MLKLTAVALAAGMAGTLFAASPASAGASTGTWKYSPEQVYRFQQRQAYERGYRRDGPPYGRAYGWHRNHERWDRPRYDYYYDR